MKSQNGVIASLTEDSVCSTEILLVMSSTLIHFKKTPPSMMKKGPCLNMHFKETVCRKSETSGRRWHYRCHSWSQRLNSLMFFPYPLFSKRPTRNRLTSDQILTGQAAIISRQIKIAQTNRGRPPKTWQRGKCGEDIAALWDFVTVMF